LAELPALVQLHQQYPDSLVAITMNVEYDGGDSPESLRPDVKKKLAELNANFLALISSDPSDVLYEKLDLASIPAVLVYDRTGQLRQRFDNDAMEYGSEGFTYDDDIAPLVRELMDAPNE